MKKYRVNKKTVDQKKEMMAVNANKRNMVSRCGRIPVGCAACGGPYPMCKPSCPIFDD